MVYHSIQMFSYSRFIETIAKSEKQAVLKLLDSSRFFSFMMDGSTDISGDEQETIYLRTCLKGRVSILTLLNLTTFFVNFD